MNLGVLGLSAHRIPVGIPVIRAAIKFDGSTPPSAGLSFPQSAIKFNYNVEKVVFGATGVFTVYFSEPMPTEHYVVIGMVKEGPANGIIEAHTSDVASTTRKQLRTTDLSGTDDDFSEVHIVFLA